MAYRATEFHTPAVPNGPATGENPKQCDPVLTEVTNDLARIACFRGHGWRIRVGRVENLGAT